jgi:hypothetical protein
MHQFSMPILWVNLSDGLLGYAAFPCDNNRFYDGVVNHRGSVPGGGQNGLERTADLNGKTFTTILLNECTDCEQD